LNCFTTQRQSLQRLSACVHFQRTINSNAVPKRHLKKPSARHQARMKAEQKPASFLPSTITSVLQTPKDHAARLNSATTTEQFQRPLLGKVSTPAGHYKAHQVRRLNTDCKMKIWELIALREEEIKAVRVCVRRTMIKLSCEPAQFFDY
jgi:hypothetical protein